MALALFAPWVAEYLVGSHTVLDLPLIVFLVPLYGGGAVLVREVARHLGGGWPAILLLGLAYGVIEAGLVDQSMFNPDYLGEDFQSIAHVDGAGISAFWALAFVVGHAVWSVGVPVAVVESFGGRLRDEPWTSRPVLLLIAAVYAVGCWLVFSDLQAGEHFMAAPAQLAAAGLVAAALVAAAVGLRHRDRRARRPLVPGRAARLLPGPPPWPVVLVLSFVVSFVLWRPGSWVGVALSVALLALAAVAVRQWSASRRWSPMHVLAVAGGALVTYAVNGYSLHPWHRVSPGVELASDTAFAVVAVALVVLTLWRQGRRQSGRPGRRYS
ncbi:hypothetical protein ABZS66_20735 [Dactylosporangium sp. NPDC005572]|uniref:hypothetical protein n=1 Tax=Dactylosporangium sp. NPDC005572 TaxID=3156889 RepID=UPI0033AECB6E